MFTQFFNSKGVVRLEGQTVTKKFYLELLGHLVRQIACVNVCPHLYVNANEACETEANQQMYILVNLDG